MATLPPNDPRNATTFSPLAPLTKLIAPIRRRGRPKVAWINVASNYAWTVRNRDLHVSQPEPYDRAQHADLLLLYLRDHTTIYANPLPAIDRPSPGRTEIPTLWVYTDGSYHPQPPRAGWGALLVLPTDPASASHDNGEACGELHDRVPIDPTDPIFQGALILSNSTAELSAIIEVLHWATRELRFAFHLGIRYDSQWAAQTTLSAITVSKNSALARATTNALLRARATHYVSFEHVRAHQGHLWNEGADALANRGAAGIVSRPTYASLVDPNTAINLNTEELRKYNPDWSLSLQAAEALIQAAPVTQDPALGEDPGLADDSDPALNLPMDPSPSFDADEEAAALLHADDDFF